MARPEPLDQLDEGTAKVDAVLMRNAEIIALMRAEQGNDERDMQFIERMDAVRSALADIRSVMIGMRASFAGPPVRQRNHRPTSAAAIAELRRHIRDSTGK
jgi:hypothetical protein